jgi:alpha-L-fucosidase
MQVPASEISILSLGKNSSVSTQKVASVKMLGSSEKLKWRQEDGALVILKPAKLPDWQVVGFKIEFQE